MSSETSFPAYATIQVDASVGRWDPRSRREVGLQLVLVFPHSVWAAASLQFHPGKQQR